MFKEKGQSRIRQQHGDGKKCVLSFLPVNMRSKSYRWLHAALLLAAGTLLFSAGPAGGALRPNQLLLVVNKAAPEGLRIARYYREKRRVPRQNMLVIETSRGEEIGRL
jgi:hypothetical protein